MVAKISFKQGTTRTQLEVLIGQSEKSLGKIIFVKEGQRELHFFRFSLALFN